MSVEADIFVNASVKSWERLDAVPFRPTKNWTTTFHITTSSSNYSFDVGLISTNIYNYIAGLDITVTSTVLLQVTVDNATAVLSGKGVVPMAKQHIDFALSGDEVTSGSAIAQAISTQITSLVTRAKYN